MRAVVFVFAAGLVIINLCFEISRVVCTIADCFWGCEGLQILLLFGDLRLLLVLLVLCSGGLLCLLWVF